MIPFVERLLKKRSHYRQVFIQSGASGDAVLADLRAFCKVGQPALQLGNGQTDVYATGMLAGRQEVFWRIASHLHLDDAQLLKLKEAYDDDQ